MNRHRWWLAALAPVVLWSTACGIGGTLRAEAQGAKIARSAMRCPQLDTAFGVPPRYMANETDHLYRGCGQYALVRCTVSVSAPPDQETICALVETVPAAVAMGDAVR